MPNIHNKNKNPHKKNIIIKRDLSNNKLYHLLRIKCVKNPIFITLPEWKKENYNKINKTNLKSLPIT